MNTDFGLDWIDYGMRMYDPSIGRWNGVDLLSELYYEYSPYSYVVNNPIKYIDPDGMGIDYGTTKKERRANKRAIRKAKRRSKVFRKRWRALKKEYKDSDTDLKVRKQNGGLDLTDPTNDVVADRTRLPVGDPGDRDANDDYLLFGEVGGRQANHSIVEFTFTEKFDVPYSSNHSTNSERITTSMPGNMFSHWETGRVNEYVSTSLRGNVNNRSITAQVTNMSRFTPVYVGATGSFYAISRTILARIPRGFLGRYKWKNAEWNINLRTGETVGRRRREFFEYWKDKIN